MNCINKQEWLKMNQLLKYVDFKERNFQRKLKEKFSEKELSIFTKWEGPSKYFHYSLLKAGLSDATFKMLKESFQEKRKLMLIEKTSSYSDVDLYRENLTAIKRRKEKKKNIILVNFLKPLEWDYFITVSPLDTISAENCRKKMEAFYERINENYPENQHCILYSTEPFENQGYHNHFLLKSDLREIMIKRELSAICTHSDIKNFVYVANKGADQYVMKLGIDNDYWGIRGTTLITKKLTEGIA